MTDLADLLVRSRLDPILIAGLLWLFFAITEARK